MVWGGSLNSNGSKYLINLLEADKVVKYLEKLKKKLKPNEKFHLTKTIDIITKYINQLNEAENEE